MPHHRRTLSRRARLTRSLAVLIVLATVVVVFASTRSSGSHHPRSTATSTAPASTAAVTSPPVPRGPVHYRELEIARLAHGVAGPAAGAIGTRVLFAGGLDGSSTSTARVGSIVGATVHTLPSLPSAYHDAAGAALGGALYTFGGGNGAAQLDAIVRVAADGAPTTVGRLPARSSDSSAAAVGSTVYVVGGYNGSHWLDSIVAFTLDGRAHVVAHLPVGIRYAAVGSADGRVIIAGGMSPTAHATSAIYSFDPSRGRVAKIGDLPVPISHAGATGVGNEIPSPAAKPSPGNRRTRSWPSTPRPGGSELPAPSPSAGPMQHSSTRTVGCSSSGERRPAAR